MLPFLVLLLKGFLLHLISDIVQSSVTKHTLVGQVHLILILRFLSHVLKSDSLRFISINGTKLEGTAISNNPARRRPIYRTNGYTRGKAELGDRSKEFDSRDSLHHSPASHNMLNARMS